MCKGSEMRKCDDFEYEFSVGGVRGRKVKSDVECNSGGWCPTC